VIRKKGHMGTRTLQKGDLEGGGVYKNYGKISFSRDCGWPVQGLKTGMIGALKGDTSGKKRNKGAS